MLPATRSRCGGGWSTVDGEDERRVFDRSLSLYRTGGYVKKWKLVERLMCRTVVFSAGLTLLIGCRGHGLGRVGRGKGCWVCAVGTRYTHKKGKKVGSGGMARSVLP